MAGPGAITPPKYSPRAVTQSNVVAVPKSTTIEGRRENAIAARAFTIRSAPTSLGFLYRTVTADRVNPDTNTTRALSSEVNARPRERSTRGTTLEIAHPATSERRFRFFFREEIKCG